MKILLIVLSAIFAFNSFAQELKEVTILHWNDFHARNQPYKVSKKDTVTGEPVYYWVGGVGSMTGYLKKYRTPNSLVLNAGDDFQGTPISNFTRGRSQIEILNSYNIDAFVLGNHEFDYSQYSLDSALALAKFDYLSSNVYLQSQNKLMGKPYVIKEINGVKFGIIGLTLPDLFETSLPANVTDLVMLNVDSVLTVNINEVKSRGADVVVLLSHSGLDEDKLIAEKFYSDIDIIVGGHSHSTLFKPVRKNGVVIVQAGSYGRNLGKLDLKIDTEKDTVTDAYGMLIETVLDSAIYDKDAAAKVDNMIEEYLPQLSVKIGTLETDWRASYSDESNLGQFEADAFRMKTGADIGFVNGGGLRKSLLKGDILVGDIWEINPFGNEIQTITVSGKTLKQMMKNNIKIRLEKISKGEGAELLHNSGLTYSYDSKKANEGSDDFIVSMNIGRSEVADDQMYTIATNNYVLSQFKKFFGEIPETITPKDTGWNDRDLIIEVVKEMKVINSVVEKRVVDVSKQ
ncbi:MAG: bifunctional metallophosphatase/5'-nucleotidase [Ignavibacteria bacterium]|nr:bifunctional metallophosphatase/5'-nucleotidase [Ignavibacteria bacterium]